MAIGKYEIWKGDQLDLSDYPANFGRELEKNRMQLLISERGKLLDFSSSESFDSVHLGKGFEQTKELLKAIFPTMPKQGVLTGDKVAELNVSLDVPHSFLISMSMDAIVQGLPIRLTPMTATCRVPPLSRVKLGIGWSRGVARDAEQ